MMKYGGRFGVALTLSLLIGLLVDVQAFVPTPRGGLSISVTRDSAHTLNRGLFARKAAEEDNFLLQEFKVANGERIHPYKILKINRSATRQEVKQAYRDLSRRYHPDGARHRDILPGSCNNLDDVRDHWERIKLSYEILSDTKMRKRFDRHEALADPGKAMQRAALGAVGSGFKGVFNMGAFAVTHLVSRVSSSSSSSTVETTEVEQTDAAAESAQTEEARHNDPVAPRADSEPLSAVMILEMPSSNKEREHEGGTRARPPVARKRRVKPSKTVGSPEAAAVSSKSTTIANASTTKSRRKVKSEERLKRFQKALVD
jgi:curved DNA-binding protein CbpA